MPEILDGIVSLVAKLFPLILVLSMFGIGRGKKNAKKPSSPGRAGPARPIEETFSPQPFDPFEEQAPPRRVPAPVAAPPRPPAPPPVPKASPRPMRKARVESTEAYAIDAGHAYDIGGGGAGTAYDLAAGEESIKAYATAQDSYGIKEERSFLTARQLVNRRQLKKEDLRRAILMREVIDQPVALRKEQQRYW